MKRISLLSLLAIVVLGLVSFKNLSDSNKYKCMIQMTNYSGEGAYIVISLLNPEGEYIETLNVKGEDDEWYNTVESWWDFYGKKRNDIDAITGATISGGERSISVIEIDSDKLDKGYKLRFESAVEDQEYYESDVEFDLTSENVKSKIEGKGFIRYVRMMPQ
ncbi:MAG: flagellin biosynthesis protein FlgD [Flavobacteriaceae bacterium]|uniref:DUF2271 domain-containing protein n=1 Tax=Winogradskyella sp. SYSU M77433 TaxID=3042722 RepID=UPI000C655B08|nr:DUF2271 domain-containing protein [Winogradskyella sp. SYSU M77433]MAX69992.1 flagellin biosynthesis protein FlgD [Flavobacteriaceae bacterium]MDH7914100.1 DUF2271 domain-containing protein [Winogradskyella sp. SYSU M77433]|tara:strand:+ start:134 stop:619 length:486 start_codon:yes stop_codon:yes gene_type:complete